MGNWRLGKTGKCIKLEFRQKSGKCLMRNYKLLKKALKFFSDVFFNFVKIEFLKKIVKAKDSNYYIIGTMIVLGVISIGFRIWMFERVEMNEGYFSKKCYKTNLYFDFFTLHHEVEAFDTCPIFIFTLAA